MLTLDQLKLICPRSNSGRLAIFVEPLNSTFDEFEINTPLRQQHFLAQVAHESGGFVYVRELASGESYEFRKDLGNTEKGDGPRYKGRGLIQITGRANMAACGDALGLDLLSNPGLLEEPIHAARSAGWFWKSRGLNELADKGDLKAITKRVNGGLNGYSERIAYWERAKETLC